MRLERSKRRHQGVANRDIIQIFVTVHNKRTKRPQQFENNIVLRRPMNLSNIEIRHNICGTFRPLSSTNESFRRLSAAIFDARTLLATFGRCLQRTNICGRFRPLSSTSEISGGFRPLSSTNKTFPAPFGRFLQRTNICGKFRPLSSTSGIFRRLSAAIFDERTFSAAYGRCYRHTNASGNVLKNELATKANEFIGDD